ncbi:MAG: helix-turn-helix transcriptional regulator [Clostridia bacterium]|nr:helix-turn-helix transcriptional regulator [Clostridia bacterium]
MNLTQSDLALMVGVDRSTVAKWELGIAFPRVEVLLKLSEVFKCTVDELLKG